MESTRRKPITKNIQGVIRDLKNVALTGMGVLLCILVCTLAGCGSWEQPGETAAEGHRRHVRGARINKQEMAQDIDRAFLLDEPSKMTDKRIP